MTRLLIRVAYRSTGWNQSRRIVLRIRALPVAELARSEFMVSRNDAVDHEEKMGSQREDSPLARYRVSRNFSHVSRGKRRGNVDSPEGKRERGGGSPAGLPRDSIIREGFFRRGETRAYFLASR